MELQADSLVAAIILQALMKYASRLVNFAVGGGINRIAASTAVICFVLLDSQRKVLHQERFPHPPSKTNAVTTQINVTLCVVKRRYCNRHTYAHSKKLTKREKTIC